MEHEQEHCQLPFRKGRVGSLWMCPVCNTLWTVRYWSILMDTEKRWFKVGKVTT